MESIVSQTDVSSFGIFASSSSATNTTYVISLLLSWNKEQWGCTINDAISQTNQIYMCESADTTPTASLASNTYEMKIELISHDPYGVIRIETIRVVDQDGNFYEIDTFCLPPEFHQTGTRGTSLERLECCYWSQRYSYNNYAMGSKENNALKITYAQFRSNVLSYPNQGHEGAIKPPMITEFGIITLNIIGAESSSSYSLTLHWDTMEYSWSVQPNQRNKTYTKLFSIRDTITSCEFSSGFSLQIAASSDESLGINSIVIKDESGYYYNIDVFCLSDSVEQWQQYIYSGKHCDAELSKYLLYHGFIYNGTNTTYFIWDQTVFSKMDENQQALVVDNEGFSEYNCNAYNSPTAKDTIFKDDMDDPISTGWIFEGTYEATLNSHNCPSGINDRCARLSGHEVSAEIDSSMEITVDVTSYVNLEVKYDLALRNMSSNSSCYLYYAFDLNLWSLAKNYTGSGSSFQLFVDELWTAPDNLRTKYLQLTLKLWTDALHPNEHCYIDNLHVFGINNLIEIDDCESFDSSWTYSGAVIQSSYCHSGSCIYLDRAPDWARKTYDISARNYNNLQLRVDFKTQGYYGSTSSCFVYYRYDIEPFQLLGRVDGSGWSSHTNQKFNFPDSMICGAQTLAIQFKSDESYNDCTIDNVILWGNKLATPFPTTAPTEIPTMLPTFGPSFNPTAYTYIPSMVPTKSPTYIPTLIPTIHPTKVPTTGPTQFPTRNPSQYPTKQPTKVPTVETASLTSDPTADSTVYPTIYPSKAPTSQTTLPTDTKTSLADGTSDNMFSETKSNAAAKSVAIVFVVISIILLLIAAATILLTLYRKKVFEGNQDKQVIKNQAPIHDDSNEGNDIEMEQLIKLESSGYTAGENIDNVVQRQKKITAWFDNHVKLMESNQKYYSKFMLNGYDQLELITEINDDILIKMGINKIAHRNRILKAIQVIDTDYIAH